MNKQEAKKALNAWLEFTELCRLLFSGNENCPYIINDLKKGKWCKMAKEIADEMKIDWKKMTMATKQMGCVVTVLIVSSGNAYLTWLGDSRIYMLRDGNEIYRTEDHSIVNEMAKIKTLSASSYEKYASIVTKSIMGNIPVDVAPIRKIEVEEGDVFILCTDGFHKEIDMTKALKYDDSKKEELYALANDISDNYTFVKVKI